MGDHTHTCFALGGMLESDPAGVALDANKRLLLARDSTGKVRARQLLAISEDGRLVCFPVYSAGEDRTFDDLFFQYDQAFARHLETTIHTDDDYEVASILSSRLWDDGPWERWLVSRP